MADHVWNGTDPGNEGDLGVAANWTGGLPIAAGDVWFPDGSQAVTAGFAALSAINIASLNAGPDYQPATGGLGLAGTPVEFGNITALFWNSGSRSNYLSAKVITSATIQGGAQTASMLNFEDHSGGGLDIVELDILGPSGVVSVPDSVILRSAVISDADDQTRLVVGASVSNLDRLAADSGLIQTSTAAAVMEAYGNVVDGRQQIGEIRVLQGSGTAPLVRIAGGKIDYRSDGDVTLVENWPGGVFDATRQSAAGVVTIATLERYSRSVTDLRNGLGNFTVTNDKNKGGGLIGNQP